MNPLVEWISHYGGAVLVGIFWLVMLGAWLSQRRQLLASRLRAIPAFVKLRHASGQALENGLRLHILIGSGGLNGERGAASLVGLSMLNAAARAAVKGDRPPVTTSGDGEVLLLSQDAMRRAYRDSGIELQYEPSDCMLPGLGPMAYTAGALIASAEQQVAVNLLAGHMGVEAVLLADSGQRQAQTTIAGSESLLTQAVLTAAADEALIGEELFAGGAYLEANSSHAASLMAEDTLRWVLILLILAGVILKLAGAL